MSKIVELVNRNLAMTYKQKERGILIIIRGHQDLAPKKTPPRECTFSIHFFVKKFLSRFLLVINHKAIKSRNCPIVGQSPC